MVCMLELKDIYLRILVYYSIGNREPMISSISRMLS
jgi:hypothetical protein